MAGPDERRRDVFIHVVGRDDRQTGIRLVEQRVVFLPRTFRVVAQGLQVEGRLGPGSMEDDTGLPEDLDAAAAHRAATSSEATTGMPNARAVMMPQVPSNTGATAWTTSGRKREMIAQEEPAATGSNESPRSLESELADLTKLIVSVRDGEANILSRCEARLTGADMTWLSIGEP